MQSTLLGYDHDELNEMMVRSDGFYLIVVKENVTITLSRCLEDIAHNGPIYVNWNTMVYVYLFGCFPTSV